MSRHLNDISESINNRIQSSKLFKYWIYRTRVSHQDVGTHMDGQHSTLAQGGLIWSVVICLIQVLDTDYTSFIHI